MLDWFKLLFLHGQIWQTKNCLEDFNNCSATDFQQGKNCEQALLNLEKNITNDHQGACPHSLLVVCVSFPRRQIITSPHLFLLATHTVPLT